MKTITVSAVVYEMLLELSKKKRVKPDLCAELLIALEYNRVQH